MPKNPKTNLWLITLMIAVVVLSACTGATESPALDPTSTPPPEIEPTSTPAAKMEPTDAAPTEEAPAQEGADLVTFTLTSSAFTHEAPIPVKYSCDGDNVSSPLAWTDPPGGTVSFALINDDPDAPGGTWIHWVLYNIPGDTRSLEEAVPAQAELADGSLHGENSWGRFDYGGPCPPGGTHRYFFKLYALDSMLEVGPGADKATLLDVMEGHILAEAELMGTYTR